MSFNIRNYFDDKITSVYGVPKNIAVFGVQGTIEDSGIPITVGAQMQKQPGAVSGNLAVFGSGSDIGQVLDSGTSINDNSPPSPTVLWTSQKIVSLIPIGSFLPLAGGTMSGNIIMNPGTIITIPDQPMLQTSAVNKAYVDSQISVPNATTAVLGKIQLSGDFSSLSTAINPIIVSATTTTEGKIKLSGDLSGTSSFPVIAQEAVTLTKMAQLSSVSKLIGSSNTSTVVTEISVGGSLQILGENCRKIFRACPTYFCLFQEAL